MPAESPAVFGDALRRLAAAATYLYQDGPRFWYGTQPTVTKLAEDRADLLKRDPDKAAQELDERLRADVQEGRLSSRPSAAGLERRRGRRSRRTARRVARRASLRQGARQRGGGVAIHQLVEDFARYLYLPRLAGPEVLVQAIRDGVELLTWRSDTFAFAESYDESAGRYRGLRGGQMVSLTADSAGLLVKPGVAWRQIEAETAPAVPPVSAGDPGAGAVPGPSTGPGDVEPVAATPPRPRRFHGTVHLDPARIGRDASRIADEVVAHLAGQVGAEVQVTLEIEATLPDGASEQIVRTVTENSRTLKFASHGFESE